MISRGCRGVPGALLAVMVAFAPAWALAPSAWAAGPSTDSAEPSAPEAPGAGPPRPIGYGFSLFSYAEMGATFSLHGSSRGIPGATSTGTTNLFRDYDVYDGYTFNMAEWSLVRAPDEAFPLGMGLTLTAGEDARKNHSIGMLRDEDDQFPFRNTPWFDVQEAYVSARIPLGAGVVVRAGKFVSTLGYEVIESPMDLNYSRGYLFTFATPQTLTGAVASYKFAEWLSAVGGIVLGWDRSDTGNDAPSGAAQVTLTPLEQLPITFGFIVGPERSGDRTPTRLLLDLTASYTPVPRVTLAVELLYLWQANDAFLTAQGSDRSAQSYGIAAYAAYDVFKDLRLAARQEWFNDADGTRTATAGGVTLFSTTGTVQYHVWKGLFARGEYRHDSATEKVFGCWPEQPCRHTSQDTLSASVYYRFF